jgi:hypothetical protein
MLSAEQLLIQARLNLASFTEQLLLLKTKATELETRIGSLTSSDLAIIQSISEDVNELIARKIVVGGNITISDTQPSNPQQNDLWFDLSVARR